jgi:uncharacterized protein DUF3105
MADQGRATKRERKEEAKRRRMEELKRRQRRAQLRKLYTIGITTAVIVGLVAIIVVAKANSGKKDKELNSLAATAGCDALLNPKVLDGTHISPPATGSYNTNPPSSGAHYFAAGIGPITTGIHTTEVPNEGFVHNLEHGHIIILYKQGLDASLLNALTEAVKKDPQWMLIAPRTDMPYQLAFAAWGHLEGCKTPNAKAVDVLNVFHDRFKNKGPEHAAGTPQGV